MKRSRTIVSFLLFVFAANFGFGAGDYPIQPISFEKVQISDSFWLPRIETNRNITIPYAFKKCEDTGRVDNFRIAGGIIDGTSFLTVFPFDDSDIYKIVEGAAYSLTVHPDPELDDYLDYLIEIVAKAQENDGYLYTARTIDSQKPVRWVDGPRWSNLGLGHELYNLGHLYEAAAAHYLATGKKNLLNVATKSADLICSVFGPDKKIGVPGHQEVEIGLVKLYRVTGEQRYLDLAKFFLDERGQEKDRKLNGPYSQDHKPVVEQDEAVGHAVRAGYMYSAMTDIAALTGDPAYQKAVRRIWENVVSKKYYITGGVGARHSGEAFGDNYELPNFSAYNETCAAIANALWNYRMFLLFGDAQYIDVLERTLYNGVLPGIGLSGDVFFYPNPLSVGAGGNPRSPWFNCSCCPSNLCRFLPSIPGYIYAQREDEAYVNLFVGSETSFSINNQNVGLKQSSDYPWDGDVRITVSPERDTEFTLCIRIPGWARNRPVPSDLYHYLSTNNKKTILKINGKKISHEVADGYARVTRAWKAGDRIDVEFPMKVRRVAANEKVSDDAGRVALEYGPLVYCVEWCDYEESVFNLLLPDRERLTVQRGQNLYNLVNGINVIKGNAYSLRQVKNSSSLRKTRHPFKAIPYYAWAHRGPGAMTVWPVNRLSEIRPTKLPTLALQSTASVSFIRQGGENLLSAGALNDLQEPKNSDDRTIPRYHWWPHQGTAEWVQYDFSQEETVSSVSVYWFDDSGHGGCRVPASWKVLYKDGDGWKPVAGASEYGVEKDRYNSVQFDPVSTHGLRLEIQSQDQFSGGILEWIVNKKGKQGEDSR